jgi:hypothetical protein
MKEEILQIASDLREGHITSNEAKEQLLRLFDVSCQCEACKQDKIDSNYRKYIELNKN